MIRSKQNRTDLRSAIPLEKPIILIIEPSNMCNFKCCFCPVTIPNQGKYVHAKPHNMTLTDFKLAIDSAKGGFGAVKMLQLHNFGEPLCNPNIAEMVEYAVASEVFENIRMYSNGALLTPELSRNIAFAFNKGKQSHIQFSIEHVTDGGYLEITQSKVKYDNLIAQIAYFYSRLNHDNVNVVCKLINNSVTETQSSKFLEDFRGICDSAHVEQLEIVSEKQVYRHGQEVSTYDGHLTTLKKVCTAPFYILAVRSNLDVIGCSEDIFRLGRIGSLSEQPLLELWNSEALFRRRLSHLKGETNKICSYCTRFAQQLDDIDDAADVLIERLNASHAAGGAL
jgi:MoaA/NifB/PqqE/SkfB family radical SAM enzyme